MKAHTRRAVAYIVFRLARNSASAVYDYEASAHFHFSGDVTSKNCSAYDHGQGCHISGTPPSLYHHGNGKHLTVEMTDNGFSGYDYDSGKHFTGTVNGSTISLYDYDDGRFYSYSV
jgi:hypothetical protein